jgi:hypothetical protein
MRFSATGMIHASRLSKQLTINFSSLHDFFEEVETGELPTYSFIEPSPIHAHNDYHPALNAVFPAISAGPPSSILGGEELLEPWLRTPAVGFRANLGTATLAAARRKNIT